MREHKEDRSPFGLKSRPVHAQHLPTRDVQGSHGITVVIDSLCIENPADKSLYTGIVGMRGQWSKVSI